MRSFLINKNLFLYYWLKKRIGKREAFWVANTIEKGILIFGREQMGKRKWWHMNFTGVMKQVWATIERGSKVTRMVPCK
jgi:hypothetical protein